MQSAEMYPWCFPMSPCCPPGRWCWCRECPAGSNLCTPPAPYRLQKLVVVGGGGGRGRGGRGGERGSFWYHDGVHRDHTSWWRRGIPVRRPARIWRWRCIGHRTSMTKMTHARRSKIRWTNPRDFQPTADRATDFMPHHSMLSSPWRSSPVLPNFISMLMSPPV